MKILFFTNSLRCGGKERRLTELMKVLKLKENTEFELAVMSDDIHYEEIFEMNIPIYYLQRKVKKDPFIFKKFYNICKQSKPDVIHCWDSMTAVYAIPAAKLLNIVLVNGLITDAPSKQSIFSKNWLTAQLTFLFSNVIIGNSKAGLKSYNVPKSKSFYIHNGFNFKRVDTIISNTIIRSQMGIHTKYIIGMVASFSDFKDYKTYFNAAQLLLKTRNDITFLAIGSETDSISAKSLISEQHTDKFRFLGKQSNVESFINSMDICILSTFTEGISNSILEYMALGKPVIATLGGGTNELVKDKETGFLVNLSNPEELAQKINILLANDFLRGKMGNAGKHRIRTYFSIEKMVNRYISIYNYQTKLSREYDKEFIREVYA